MKEKYISLILVASLLMTATIVLGANETPATETIEQRFSFSKPRFTYENELIEIKVEGAASTTHRDGAPKLPVHKTVLEFPMGTRINDVEFAHSPTKSMYVPTKISPSPTPIPLNKMGTQQELPMDETIYNSATYYPEKWFTYKIRVGLNKNNERTTFLTVDVYPVRYSPLNNKIQYITDGTLKVTVNKPANTSDESNTYDLLVISASAYLEELQRLVQHKENHGIKTKLVSADEIHGIGRDKQEQIKHYIKNAIENWGIKYVLLVGGYRSFFGFNKPELQLPIRYVYLNDGGEDGFPSDLYYADIYYYDPVSGYAFDDWDSNGNGRFGEWDWYGYDDLDLIPDVHLGRLACRTIKEAKTMVDKIINYENTYNANENWFKKMLVVTGDDFQDQNMLDIQWNVSLVPDGEYIIHAQTTNCDGVKGTVNEVHVTVDHEATSSVTFSEEDHLTTGRCYTADPVAEITVPSDGDVLGNTDVKNPSPPRAYEGERWTPIQYEKGILHIMGKAYDPQPQADNHPNGPYTTIEVWVTNNAGETVFGPVYADSEMWF
ncbi:MAG TPA: hypothetical protein ENI45_04955, partial [Thermoplasmatales archaeon]|nr:hypothetical protein [Thermoplasmatales archaeon]